MGKKIPIRKEKPLVEQVGFCLALHFATFEKMDEEIKRSTSNFLRSFPSTKWKIGNFWSQTELKDFNAFPISFEVEIRNFEKYYEGIQTRNIGNLIIQDPSVVFKESKTSRYIVSFRKIHDSYSVMFFSFSQNLHLKLLDCAQTWEKLEEETMLLTEILWKNTSERFKHNLLGPSTVFYFVIKPSGFIKLPVIDQEIENESSTLHMFLQEFLCAENVKPERLPLSTLDDKVIVLRHPSYNFSSEMSEKFLIFPLETEAIESYMRKIDILSSIEHYFTKLFKYAKTAGYFLGKLDKKSSDALLSREKFGFLSADKKITSTLSTTIHEMRLELLQMYHSTIELKDEIQHMYEDMTYLIDGAIVASSHTQILENQISNRVEGVIKSIGIEAQMRVKHVELYALRIGGRSYGLISELSAILDDLHSKISSQTMLGYTNQIRWLTIILAIFTGVMIIPQIPFIINKLTTFISNLIGLLSQ